MPRAFLLALLLLPGLVSFHSHAQVNAQAYQAQQPGYLARLEGSTPEELTQLLSRAEQFYQDQLTEGVEPGPAVTFVLHGPAINVFLRQNYSRHKPLVDLAARLSALDVVEIRVCRTWMRSVDAQPAALLPFVETVPFGPAEIERLLNRENYVQF